MVETDSVPIVAVVLAAIAAGLITELVTYASGFIGDAAVLLSELG